MASSERIVLALASGVPEAKQGIMALHMCAYIFTARFGGPEFVWRKEGPFNADIAAAISWLATHGRMEISVDGINLIEKNAVPGEMEEDIELLKALVRKCDIHMLVELASVYYWAQWVNAKYKGYGPVEVSDWMKKEGVEIDATVVENLLAKLESMGFLE